MKAGSAHVSATISATTKEKLDRFPEGSGPKKKYVAEQALLFFLASRRELPDEAFVPTRIVREDPAFDRLVERLRAPPPPALRELMGG